MKLAKAFIALMLALVLTVEVSAQVSEPINTMPPAPTLPGGGEKEKKMAEPKTAGDETEAEEEEEIVPILGPQIGPKKAKEPTPAELESFYRGVWREIGKRYIDPMKLRGWGEWEHKFDGQLKTADDLDRAVKAMVGSLADRWTDYTSAKEIEQQRKESKDGALYIGMMLRPDASGNWRIDGLMYGSPAQQSVLREGDWVKSVSRPGQKPNELAKLSAAEVDKLFQGKEGEKITVVANWDNADHTVELTFAKIEPVGVEADLLPGKIGYIRLPTFVSPEVVAQFIQTLGELFIAADGELNGLVFDLRYNGGGRVDMALLISSTFVENGVVTRTTVREDRSVTETVFRTIQMPEHLEQRMAKMQKAYSRMLMTVPMVVLTNGSTASASEITTGALMDNNRAYVIGTKTFGKAVGFNRGKLPNGAMLSITTLIYLTPSGTDIGGKGIMPNKVVEQPRDADEDEQLKAAHAYLMGIVKMRAQQMRDAREIATGPQTEAPPEPETAPFEFHTLYIVLGLMVLGVACLFVLFARSRRKR